MNGFVTTKQAAEIIGVSPGRVRQYVVEERLFAVRVGRDNLIRRSEVVKFAKKPRRTGRPAVPA